MNKYYKYYFQQLAKNDEQIADTDAKKAFFYIQDIYDPDAFDNAIRSAGKTPAMLLERYRTKQGDNSVSRNYRKKLYGRFNIITKADPGEAQTIDDAIDQCESIADDILAKMREQLQEGDIITIPGVGSSKKVFFPYQEIDIDPIGPIDLTFYGVSVSFYFGTAAQGNSIPANWPA